MSDEELKQYNQRLELLNTTRKLQPADELNLFESATSMRQVEEDYQRAIKEFPQFKEQLKRMAEVKMQRLMEKL